MAVVRILRHWLPSASDMVQSTLTAFEAEVATVLGTLSVQQRNAVQVQLTSTTTPSGGIWLVVFIMSPL